MYDKKPQTTFVSFKADCHALKAWIDKRVGSLKKVRSEFEPLWKELRLQYEPNIGKALLEGDRDNAASARELGRRYFELFESVTH